MGTSISQLDAQFARLAVKLRYVTPEQVRGSVELHRRYQKSSDDVPSVPRILVHKGYIPRDKAEGLLHHILSGRALVEPAPPMELALPSDVPGAPPPVIVEVPEPVDIQDISELKQDGADLDGSDGGQPLEADGQAMLKGMGATVLRGEIKGYKILEVIGEGSMGVVYRAHQISMDRIVALKVLPADKTKDQSFVEQFLTEARSAGRLNHPNLIRVHEVGRYGDTYYYSMEYVDGLTLGEMMDEFEGGRIDPKRAVNIFVQVAAALDHGYRADIIHREIRPDCVMITEGDQAKLEGLGLTKDENTRFLQGENAYYVAPEQCRGNEPDTRSDLYSLGCCLFHCLAGEPPFQGGGPKDVLGRRLVSDPPHVRDINPDVPQDLAAICDRMMARDPDQRFPVPSEAMDALKQVSFGPPMGDPGTPSGRRGPARPSARLRRGRGGGTGRNTRRRRRRFKR